MSNFAAFKTPISNDMLSPIRQFFICLQLGMGGIIAAMSGQSRTQNPHIREWRSRIENYKYQGTLTDRQKMSGDFHRIAIDMRSAFTHTVQNLKR